MSGTLVPIQEYKNNVGIASETAIYPFPFPSNHRKILYIDDVTTKYYMTNEMIAKITDCIQDICNNIKRNILIIFPSYEIQNRFLNSLSLERQYFIERKGESDMLPCIELRHRRTCTVFINRSSIVVVEIDEFHA